MHRLHTACKEGVALLAANLTTSSSIDERDPKGLTPICHAANAGHVVIVNQLIGQGANPSGQSSQDLRSNILYQACQNTNAQSRKTLLHSLLNNFNKLKFTDGTQKYHIQLALGLLINHKSPRLDNAKFNNPTDRLSAWIKAQFYASTATDLLAKKEVSEGIDYLKLAITHFERFKPSTDDELTDYLTSLQSLLICVEQTASTQEKIVICEKMFAACDAVQQKDETDFRLQTFNAFNLAELYRASDKTIQAKKHYVLTLENLLRLSKNSDKIFEKIPEFLSGFADCYQEKSKGKAFLQLGVRCFTPAAKVKDELVDSLNCLLNEPEFHKTELQINACLLLEVIMHVYNLGLLKNKELISYLKHPEIKIAMENIYDLLREEITISAARHSKLRFFTTRNNSADTMDDNLPPNDLERTHSSTASL